MPQRQVETAKLRSKVTPLKGRSVTRSGITDKIQAELDGLNIKINSSLTKVISSASEEVTLSAIEALKEAKFKGEVPNPTGFLVRAIKEGWTSNEEYEQKAEIDIFNQWYQLANKNGIALASQGSKDGIMIYTNDEKWVLFQEMLDQYPLDKINTK